MEITREQFLRGISAVQGYAALVRAVSDAFKAAESPYRMDDLGGWAVVEELTRQLEERCGDVGDPHGSMINYMLYESGGTVRDSTGRTWMTRTPEELWAYWEESGTGPFERRAKAA